MKARMACIGVTPFRVVGGIASLIAPIACTVVFSKSFIDGYSGLVRSSHR